MVRLPMMRIMRIERALIVNHSKMSFSSMTYEVTKAKLMINI